MAHGWLRAAPFALLLVSFALFGSARASAEPVRIDLVGEITSAPFTSLMPGDAATISIFVDSEAVDENAAPGPYLATTPGSFQSQFKDLPLSIGTTESISADADSGDWEADLVTVGLPGGEVDVTISLSGSGASADQILPDFSSFTSGTVFFDGGGFHPFISTIDIDVHTVDIVSLSPPAVPALSGGAQLSLNVLLLGAGLCATGISAAQKGHHPITKSGCMSARRYAQRPATT